MNHILPPELDLKAEGALLNVSPALAKVLQCDVDGLSLVGDIFRMSLLSVPSVVAL
jgi:hypothetical protein